MNNGYPSSFINRHINRRLKKIKYRDKSIDNDLTRNKNFITIPYIKGLCEGIGRVLKRRNIDFAYTVHKRLNCLIKLGKDRLINDQHMGVVYKIECENCEACYIGQTKRHLETRVKEHRSDISKDDNCRSVVSKHRALKDHNFDWCNTKILHHENHRRKREIAEMVFIKKHSNSINMQKDMEDLPAAYVSIL
ncbi:hypothetical protein X777_03199 [Ooceraea biroi]|uniref:GIY-YIG domain-containing protein n=1 Tax=Ooceraea biroi TaxID=2015173 RepID=A0A026WNV3_OOCBI|nr:hypothetical protein X777_03199 [Ooceraea biroi]